MSGTKGKSGGASVKQLIKRRVLKRKENDMKHLESSQIIDRKQTLVPVFYSACGYGRKIPTQHMVKLADNRWRRVHISRTHRWDTQRAAERQAEQLINSETEYERKTI